MAAAASEGGGVAPANLTLATVEPLVRTGLGTRLVARCPGLSTKQVSLGAKPPLFERAMVPAPELEQQLVVSLDQIRALGDFGFVENVFAI